MTTYDFEMPSLGADMDEGTITEWMVEVGDQVERGDVVAVVETDKADIDVEIWHPGVVEEILVPTGELVSVGTPLARLAAEAGDLPDPPPEVNHTPPPAGAAVAPTTPLDRSLPPPPERQPRVPTGAGPRVMASPLARSLAAQRGLDLATIDGTGPGGAVLAGDLADGPSPAGRAEPTRPSAAERMRNAIAAAMTTSWQEIPHYHLSADLDLEQALSWLERGNQERELSDRILPAALLLKAAATALAKQPELNGFWIDGGFVPGDGVHLAVAVSLREGGLLTPTIHHADRLDLAELMARLRDLVGRARNGRLKGSELAGSTITVTNLGDRGVRTVHGVIYPPQVALLGFGRIDNRAVVADGAVVAHRVVTATLAADHRASDGQRGARLLNAIDRLLQEPEHL